MMKLTTFTLLFLSINICFSQDIIFKKNKEFIQAKVIDSNATEIFYKKYFNQNGPTYIIFKSELLKIHYETGKVENYAVLISAPVQKKIHTLILIITLMKVKMIIYQFMLSMKEKQPEHQRVKKK